MGWIYSHCDVNVNSALNSALNFTYVTPYFYCPETLLSQSSFLLKTPKELLKLPSVNPLRFKNLL